MIVWMIVIAPPPFNTLVGPLSSTTTTLVGPVKGIHILSKGLKFVHLQVKSFLTGNPPISIALNDSLAIGRREGNGGAYGGAGAHDVVMLDDCNFHETVMLHRFETERVLELVPPDGEFACMNYRYTLNSDSIHKPQLLGLNPSRSSRLDSGISSGEEKLKTDARNGLFDQEKQLRAIHMKFRPRRGRLTSRRA